MYHMKYILVYDIPVSLPYFKLQVNRRLKRIGAKLIQRSVWGHDDLNELIKLAILIKNVGGKARIMEEKLIFE